MLKKVGLWALGCALFGGLVSAQEFVEFRDGRFIRVASHRVGAEWMRIDLGKGSWIEVPRQVVDAVEYKGRVVYRRTPPAATDVLFAGADAGAAPLDPLVRDVIRAQRTLPDPALFRPSPFAVARRDPGRE